MVRTCATLFERSRTVIWPPSYRLQILQKPASADFCREAVAIGSPAKLYYLFFMASGISISCLALGEEEITTLPRGGAESALRVRKKQKRRQSCRQGGRDDGADGGRRRLPRWRLPDGDRTSKLHLAAVKEQKGIDRGKEDAGAAEGEEGGGGG